MSMSTSISQRDLWPDDLGPGKVIAPVTILREQASALAKKTRGLLEGRVDRANTNELLRTLAAATGEEGAFTYSFRIVAPALGPYQYELLRINHDYHLDPVRVRYLPAEEDYDADDEAAYVETLRKCFAHDETKRIIASLLAQIEAQPAGQ
jgi:hypothetical protein